MNFKIILAHTRLSVLDPEPRSKQPMELSNCDWTIVFNGEIYNYLELRSELVDCGWSFVTNSDTEVLLKAWAQWGVDALPRLNGMFSFCVFNKLNGEAYLVRDRFGIKPLLWARTPSNGLVFSSSLAIVADINNSSVDIDACAFGLQYRVFEGPDICSPFDGVQEVLPGTWLKIQIPDPLDPRDNALVLSSGKWYDLYDSVRNKQAQITNLSDEDLLAYSYDLLEDAVKIRLRSDVDLAVSLSGGLDSSTIASIASKHALGLQGFTYGSSSDHRSEGPVVAKLTEEIAVTANFIWPDMKDHALDELLERTLVCQEAPFPGLSILAQNEVFRSVRASGYKVLLGGQGGDEIFAGYRKFFVVATRHALKNGKYINAAGLVYSLGVALLNEISSAKVYMQSLKSYRKTSDNNFKLFDWSPPQANLWGEKGCSLSDRQAADVLRWSIPSLLRYEDRNSMGNSVESRLPFMDYRLVELALALPPRLKLSNGFGKYALRTVSKGHVPDFIRLNRKKRGFDVTQNWISSGLGSSIRSRIFDNRTTLSQYIKPKADLDACLSDNALSGNQNLLAEALMLTWLTQPIRLTSN